MSQCQPVVSIVMASKNYAQFVALAVQSVLDQTFTDWELVIIDDGSTDATSTVLAPFLKDSRIRYVASDFLGQSRAKNLGARLTKGEFIAYLDADDAWQPTKLAKQLEVLRSSPKVGVCFTQRLLMDESGATRVASDPPAPSGNVLPEIFLRNFVCFSSVMVRRTVFDHVGSFDPAWDLSIDFDLWLRVAQHYEFHQVQEPLTLYRTGHGNLSKKLTDRVSTAFAIMDQRNLDLPKPILQEGYASTYRSLAYVMRSVEPITAIKLYLQALKVGGIGQKEVWKGLVWTLLKGWRGPRSAGENASVNR
jgi:glycosyltransferase involved in cell wall biosynthesis